MTQRQSAGLVVYRLRDGEPQVLLVHPGGPYWQRKDQGAWSIPKGEFGSDEEPLVAARREFTEETGLSIDGAFTALPVVRQSGGKYVHPFAVEADLDAEAIRSNLFSMEWPPRSGRMMQFAEVDRAGWFSLQDAAEKLVSGQRPILDALRRMLTSGPPDV
ncbi:MAG TPA: NUDIX domain-containing protein [Casimicrobiaceae bacterium]|nr:NUDIX domain-containing protein [Casimicrobiaceae bacterium]